MRRSLLSFALVIACGCVLSSRPVLARSADQTQKAPEGWLLAGSKPANYCTGVDRQMLHEGRPSAYLTSTAEETGGFGTLMQTFNAQSFAGKRVRLRAAVRSENVSDWAGLWMRVDSGEKVVAFDNMQQRSIKGTTAWSVYDVVLNVPEGVKDIALGVLLTGPGEVWMSGVTFEVVGADVPTTDTMSGGAMPQGPVNLDFAQ